MPIVNTDDYPRVPYQLPMPPLHILKKRGWVPMMYSFLSGE